MGNELIGNAARPPSLLPLSGFLLLLLLLDGLGAGTALSCEAVGWGQHSDFEEIHPTTGNQNAVDGPSRIVYPGSWQWPLRITLPGPEYAGRLE